MIFLDSNVFVIDLRYRDDAHFPVNRRFLDRVRERGVGCTGITNVLEVCGILSFNLSARQLAELFAHFAARYGVVLVPGADPDARLPAFSPRHLLGKMRSRMCLKDAEIALLSEQQTPTPEAFITWNARHFTGRLPFPVLTPKQWLAEKGA